jgi:hypothetical protein
VRRPPRSLFRQRHRQQAPADSDLARYVVLVPFMDSILHPCEDALDAVERLGVRVFRRPGCSAIDFCRSELASAAMLEGKEAVLFVDSDILFNPADALYILRRPEPVVAGIYAQKRYGHVNCDLPESVEQIKVGTKGQDYEALAVGAGFLRIRAEAFQKIIEHHDLPCCTRHSGAVWPFFLPMTVQEPSGEWTYMGEDYAFCWRCRAAGIPIILDTRIRLFHLGLYPYGWEEAAGIKVLREDGLEIAHFPEETGEQDQPSGEKPFQWTSAGTSG